MPQLVGLRLSEIVSKPKTKVPLGKLVYECFHVRFEKSTL